MVKLLVSSWLESWSCNILVPAIDTASTSWQNYCSCWWFQWCHSHWVFKPWERYKSFGSFTLRGIYDDDLPLCEQRSIQHCCCFTRHGCCCVASGTFWQKKVKRIWMKTGKARRDNAFSFTQLWVVLVCTGISFRAWVDFMKLLLLLTCKLYSV